MSNIKFNYRYRDGANYKNHDFAVFKNDHSVSIGKLESLRKSKLIDEIWFYADEWKLSELFLSTCDFRIDPTWHEFESVEYTDESSNSPFDLKEFISPLTVSIPTNNP
jgi:hypothetical protein